MPVAREHADPCGGRERGNVEHAAERETMADIASRTFLRVQVAVVLGDGGLVHGRTEVWRIGQGLGICVVSEKAKAVGVLAADVHVPGVIPALRRIFEAIDGAYGESLALDDGIGIAAGSQYSAVNKCQSLVR